MIGGAYTASRVSSVAGSTRGAAAQIEAFAEEQRDAQALEIQPLTEADVPTCQEIFDTSYSDLHRRHGLQVEHNPDPDWLRPILSHFLSTDPTRSVIAKIGDSAVGFASSFRREEYWFLSFLFVLPSAQGRGIGRALLGELLPRDAAVVRATVVESFQPASTGLYASVGMTPRSIKYWMSGVSRLESLFDMPSDLCGGESTHADLADIDELDRRLLGFARSADHAWWRDAGQPCYSFRRGEELVAYAYVDDGYIGPVLATADEVLCAAVASLIRAAEDPIGMSVNLSGDSAPLFQMLLKAGARIDEEAKYRFVYCSSVGPMPSSYIHHSDWLP
jgi:GNAT superfamily N-acetyltransferase